MTCQLQILHSYNIVKQEMPTSIDISLCVKLVLPYFRTLLILKERLFHFMYNIRLYPVAFKQWWVFNMHKHTFLEFSGFMLLGSFNFHSILVGLRVNDHYCRTVVWITRFVFQVE